MISHVRSLVATMAVLGALSTPFGQAAAAEVTGKVTNRLGKQVGTFSGNFNLTSFASNSAGKIVGVGTLTGTLTSRGGDVMSTVNQVVQIPVQFLGIEHSAGLALPDTCDVLFLQLGPIDLNVLGLIVHVDQITVDIDADPQGGIVGQLLCSLAGPNGLLDLNGLLNTILGSITLADLLGFLNGLL